MSEEVKREVVIRRVVAGKIGVTDAAPLLGLSERQVWRLRSRYVEQGAAALAHGNRGRAPANKIAGALRERIIRLARSRYAGCNDSHLAELLAEREGITLSRVSVRRILRGAGIASPRRHRPGRYHARRERRVAAGMLVQLDGSKARWFGPDKPFATLVAAIDDATGEVVAATFRAQEDAAGYFEVLGQMLTRSGVPLAVYSDRHGIFRVDRSVRETPEEELAGVREPTQLGRAFAELGGGDDLRPHPAGQGPRRAPLRHAAGPACGRATSCGRQRDRRGQPFPPDIPTATQRPLRAPRCRAARRVAVAPREPAGGCGLLLQVRPRRGDGQHRALPRRHAAAAAARHAVELVRAAPGAASSPRWFVQRARARWPRARALGHTARRAAAARAGSVTPTDPQRRSLPVRGATSPWRTDDRWRLGTARRIIARAKATGRSD